MRLATAPATFFALTASAALAQAAEPVQLTWNAPAGCPPREAVMTDVRRILGDSTAHRASARGEVTEVGARSWSLHLTTDIEGAQGERTLDASSCESLASAAALILALAVDPEKARAAMPQAGNGASATHADATASRRAESPPAPARGAPVPVAAVVAVGGAGELGTLPSVGGGAEIVVGALVGPVRAELSGEDWGTQTATTADGSEGTHIHLLDATLRGCLRASLGARFELDPCLGGGLVYARSDGFGTPPAPHTFASATGSGTWAALHGDLLAAWRLIGPFALRASVGAGVPLARPAFVIQQPPAPDVLLHRSYWITGTATLGLEARFP